MTSTTRSLVIMLAALVVTGSSSEQGKVGTSAGPLTAVEALVGGDRWQPDCSIGMPGCSRVRPGFQIVAVWFEPVAGEMSAELDAITADMLEFATGVAIVASDGERTERFASGTETRWDSEAESSTLHRILIGFTPPADQEGFWLHWPGNDPVELAPLLGQRATSGTGNAPDRSASLE